MTELKNFKCRCLTENGKIEKVFISAESIEKAEKELCLKKLILLSGNENKSVLKNHCKNKNNLKLFKNILNLLDSGINLKSTLEILSKENSKNGFICKKLFAHLQNGKNFSKAIFECKEYFSAFIVSFLSFGDRIGNLNLLLKQTIAFIEMKEKIKSKILNALIYPGIILLTALCAGTGIIKIIIPKLIEMFKSLNPSESDSFVSGINQIKYAFIVFAIIVLCIVLSGFILICARKKNNDFRFFTDKVLLSIPIVRKIILTVELFNFCYGMEILVESGLTIKDGISECLTLVSNRYLKRQLELIKEKIVAGHSVSKAFSENPLIPKEFFQFLSISENSGNPFSSFKSLRIQFENTLNSFAEKIIILTEPVVTVVTGIIILFMIVKIVLPIFEVYGKIL